MPEQIHRLFFALRPDAFVLDQVSRVVSALELERSVRGRWVKPSRYHLTVQFLGTHGSRPERIIELARIAAAQVSLAPFDLMLDHVDTFGGHRRPPCVLRCTAESDASVQTLRSALGRALCANGLAHLLEDRFTPHLTIGYAERKLPAPIPVLPIRWQVREFELIESHGAEARHELVDRWSLQHSAAGSSR